jgi:hypothetical protein
MPKHKWKYVASISIILFITMLGAVTWLRAPYAQTKPRKVAEEFLEHLKAGEFQKAHDLTVKSGYVGNSAKELASVLKNHCINVRRFAYTFPFQSNGNRLRRWLSGREIEIPEVHVEIEGSCLLGITVRHIGENEWKVSRFASHAG